MIERHITYTVASDQAAAFERFIADEYRPPAMKMPGIIECSLLREADHPERYQMVFRWEKAEDAVAWRTCDAHQALAPKLASLNTGMEIVAYTKVI
jgi:heme-degrading monooxygenase HmoA